MPPPDLKRTLGKFTEAVSGLETALTESSRALTDSASLIEHRLAAFVRRRLEPFEENGKTFYRLSDGPGRTAPDIREALDAYREFSELKKALEHVRGARQSIFKSLFTALTAEYRSYLDGLSRTLLQLSRTPAPDAGPDDAGEAIETEMPLRPDEQISSLERRFGADLRNVLETSPEIIEVMERAYCLAWNDGAVSARYLNACRRHNIPTDGVREGDRMEITAAYFSTAWESVYEAGLKIGCLLWRHVLPGQSNKADGAVQDFAFSLIQVKNYRLARKILHFALTVLLRDAGENHRHVFVINGALAAYLEGDRAECLALLRTEDLSAASDILKLADAVLRERFDDAAELMHRLSNQGRPGMGEYLRLPLFERFRMTTQFAAAFQNIFGQVRLPEPEVPPFHDSSASIQDPKPA